VRTRTGARLALDGRLHNDTKQWMSSTFVLHPFTVRARWFARDETLLSEEHEPARFGPVGPHTATDVRLVVTAPAQPGEYHLVLSVVQEGFAWHYELDSSLAVHVAVTVERD
jgi:hypothetical protein